MLTPNRQRASSSWLPLAQWMAIAFSKKISARAESISLQSPPSARHRSPDEPALNRAKA
jgi:hypothetical protein